MILRSLAAFDILGEPLKSRRLTAERVKRSTERILKKNPLCAIATVTDDGRAHVNTAYFAWSDALDLFFLSYPESLHCQNLKANSSMAIAVFECPQRWGELDRGLQLFGTCQEARAAAAETAKRLYAARFKPYAQWQREERGHAGEEYRFYRFVPTRLKLFDEREFGGAVFVTASVGRRSRASGSRIASSR